MVFRNDATSTKNSTTALATGVIVWIVATIGQDPTVNDAETIITKERMEYALPAIATKSVGTRTNRGQPDAFTQFGHRS